MLFQVILALAALASAGPYRKKPADHDHNKSSGSCPGGSSDGGLAATFTIYGSGDYMGSGNCNRVGACGTEVSPGSYTAAVSESLFGVGPSQGAGPGCGKCYGITIEKDATSGKELSNSGHCVVVRVTNLCPGGGNGVCGQKTLSDKNQYGAVVNFDLCQDSGASGAFFGNTGIGLATGRAVEVDCSNWKGELRKTASWA